MVTERNLQELEEALIHRIEELSFIVTGLESHEPYKKAIDRFVSTRNAIDNNWHLVMDFNKLTELRISKMAANSIINFVDDLKSDLDRCQAELISLRNPDTMVNKDYDPN